MKTLEEIKKFFPNHKFEDCFDLELMQFSAYDLIEFSQSYAREVAIASLEKASENARTRINYESTSIIVDKTSITKEENIVL